MDGITSPEDAQAERGARTYLPPRMVGKLRLLSVAEALQIKPRRYLLPGLMAPGELSAWWGAPKCGKTFLVLRLAYGLALGRGLFGREPPHPVRVLYGAAEGEGGIGTRIAALHGALGDPGDRFALIAQRMQLGPPAEHLDDFIAAAREHRAELVIVDTLARTFGEGDEDRAQDMGAFIAALDRLREEGRSKGDPMPHVAVIHHAPKDPNAKTPRGSGALLGAADLVVKIRKGEDGAPSAAVVEHAKDDEDGAVMPFRLAVVAIARGDVEARTCVAEETLDAAQVGTNRPKLSMQAKRALGFLADAISRGGNKLPHGHMFPPDAALMGVPFEEWRAECRARSLSANGEKRAENQAFQRAAEALLSAGMVATGEHDGVRLAWIVRGVGT